VNEKKKKRNCIFGRRTVDSPGGLVLGEGVRFKRGRSKREKASGEIWGKRGGSSKKSDQTREGGT